MYQITTRMANHTIHAHKEHEEGYSGEEHFISGTLFDSSELNPTVSVHSDLKTNASQRNL